MSLVRVLVLVGLMSCMSACSIFGKGGSGEEAYTGVEDASIPTAGSSILDNINFAFDSSKLDSGSQKTLEENAKWLSENGGEKVVIEGHCDERGTSEYNLALGERRARSVFDYLRSLGVPEKQMETISYGEDVPLDSSRTEDAFAKNRRAQFTIVK